MHFHSPAKRLLCLLLCLSTILALALPVSAKPASLQISSVDAAPVYYRASDSSTRIGYLLHGTALTVLGTQGKYYRIDCYDMTGFIHKSLVSVMGEKYYVNCLVNRSSVISFYKRPVHIAVQLQRRIHTLSTAQTGVPYVSGGSSPRGFDCSGFTQYIYGQLDIAIPRTCDTQLGAGLIIAKENLRCGDLVLFQRTTSHPGISTHVGIYLGEGKLIHAGSRGITVVELESSYFKEHYLCARRIIPSQNIRPVLPSAVSLLNGK